MMQSMNRRDAMLSIPAAAVGAGALTSFALGQDRGGSGAEIEPQGGGANAVRVAMQQAYRGDQYALPSLPYPYDALEPHIDEQTMRLHHDKHHQGYVNGLNSTLEALKEMRSGEIDSTKLYALERNLSFNGGGHLLHTIFWATMAPADLPGKAPQGDLAAAMNQAFGSFDGFKNYFSAVAGGVKGSGWAVLAYEPLGDRLMVFGLNEHDTKMIAGSQPLLPLDVWEHAYYLKYQNKRSDYINAWWNVVNWEAVAGWYSTLRARRGGGGGAGGASISGGR